MFTHLTIAATVGLLGATAGSATFLVEASTDTTTDSSQPSTETTAATDDSSDDSSTTTGEARVAAAIEGFEERATELGFVDTGSSDGSTTDTSTAATGDTGDTGDTSSDTATDDTVSDEDELFAACDGEAIFAGIEDDFPGSIAQQASNNFEFRTAETDSTEFSFSDIPEGVFATAVVIDPDSIKKADEIIDWFGLPETAECLSDALDDTLNQPQDPDSSSPSGAEISSEVTNTDDLGIADNSSSMAFDIEIDVLGAPLTVHTDFVIARGGDSIAVIGSTNNGDPQSGFDAAEELSNLIDDLNG